MSARASGRRSIFRNRSAAATPPASTHEPSNSSINSASDGMRIYEVPQEDSSTQPPPSVRGRFLRRGSLENTAGGGGLATPRKARSFFQRRGSFGSSTPVPMQASLSSSQATSEQEPASEPLNVAPRRRMFRRDSLGQRQFGNSESTAATTSEESPPADMLGEAPRKPFRRGSFGPRGDAEPPRPAARRASIGQQQDSVLPISDGSPISGQSSPRDVHRDSMILLTEPPRRRPERRSSLGPGISTGSPTDQLGGASSHSVQSVNSVNSEDVSGDSPRNMSSRFKDAFVKKFRKKNTKKRAKSWTLQGGEAVTAQPQQSDQWTFQQDDLEQISEPELPAPPAPISSPRVKQDNSGWKPYHEDIMEDEELCPISPGPSSLPERAKGVRFASEPEIHVMDYNYGDEEEDGGAESTPATFEEMKTKLWWNSEEMAQIRQECMELVKGFLDDTEYMEAVTKLFTAYKKAVTEEEIENALEKVAQRKAVRGLEMHIVPRGGLLCEKHRRIVLTNVASATVDGLSNTGEGWILIRKESMKASRPCRQYAQKMAEHDAMEAIEATISAWSVDDDEAAEYTRKRQEEDDEDDEDEDDDYPITKPTTPFIPSNNDVAPMAPKKHVSEVDEEEDTPQQAGEGSSQDSKS